MILKALYDYYNRCGDALAPEGMEYKEIGFLIVITKEGDFVRIEDCRIDKKRCNTFLVPKTVKRSGSKSGTLPCLMWDNTHFVLGVPKAGKENLRGQYLDAFRKKVEELSEENPNSAGISAVAKFYKKNEQNDLIKVIENDVLCQEIIDTTKNISFRVEGETIIVAEEVKPQKKLEEKTESQSNEGKICLVLGKKSEIARIHSKTPLPGYTFTSLVSFQKSSGFDSYGKEQAYNASVSVEAEFAYTTALNKMLGKDSKNKFTICNRTFLFWASSSSEASKATEDSLYNMFAGYDDSDDPNKRIDLVKKTFLSIYNGDLSSNKDDVFYILGLAPNIARIAVVYWAEIPLKDFSKTILRHFEDMTIVDGRKDKKPYLGLHSLLGAVTLGGKSSGATPNLPDALVKSIFQGIPYPSTLFQSCIRRIRAEQEVAPYNNPCRIGIIKGYLNRLNVNNKKIQVMLDKENTNVGYLCGRLFAVLEKIQKDANKNNVNTIKERYMNSASATPASVYPTILGLSVHHSEKLSKGTQIFYEKLKQEIISKIGSEGFPSHLDLLDQGRFFVGYYHQSQDFFISKETENTESQE